MGSTVLPSSLLSLPAAAAPRACASRVRLNPACIATSAAAKKPKRPTSCREDEPPPKKRRRAGEDGGTPAAAKPKREEAMSLEEKEAVNNQLVSLLLLGSGSCKVSPLPDSIVRLLQENRTGCGDGNGDIEIDVLALADDALRLIKNRVGAYLDDRARHQKAPKQSKQDAVIKQADTKTTSASSEHLPATRKESMKELLADAHVAMERVRRRQYLEELRAKARWEVAQMVRTVEWNDAYIDPQDVFR
ncbi:hypothetical protein ACP70R_029123 [Stipagrostis hirtigluma subsp. patula]